MWCHIQTQVYCVSGTGVAEGALPASMVAAVDHAGAETCSQSSFTYTGFRV